MTGCVSKSIITLMAFAIILYQQVSEWARFRSEEVGHEITLPSEGGTPLINVSVRDFLTTGKYEPVGYGLYSYLLFGNQGQTNRPARLAAIRAYLDQFDTFRMTKVRSSRDQLNVFFIPTKVEAEWIDQCMPASYAPPDMAQSMPKRRWRCTLDKKTRDWNVDELAEWVERYYDYQRASELLVLLQRLLHLDPDLDSIYVSAYFSPLMSKALPQPDPNKLLLLRLSRVASDYMEAWIEQIRIQFATPQFWDVNTLRWTILYIRSRLPEFADKLDFIGTLFAGEPSSTTKDTHDGGPPVASPNLETKK
jgi:hypothetical protein